MDSIGWVTRYAPLGASSRLRHYHWADRMRKLGWPVQVQPFFSDAYLAQLYAGGRQSKSAWIAGVGRRLHWLRRAPRDLVIEYELLPFLPWAMERQLLRHHRYILDFDDNVWEKYRRLPGLRGKFDRLTEHAEAVIVANDFLYEQLQPRASRLVKIPTLIDSADYPEQVEKFPRFTLVWIGTPVTYAYLEQMAPCLQAMARQTDFELLVIAASALSSRPIAGVPMRWLDWGEATAGNWLARAHAGLMPLPDEPFARGKSAYKLIQYQGAGLPAIASPVGENRRIIRHGVTGFLADTPEEWAEALRLLTESPTLYGEMASAAREAGRQYTYTNWEKTYCDLLKTAFAAK